MKPVFSREFVFSMYICWWRWNLNHIWPWILQGPKYQEIVNLRLGDGTRRRGQVLEVDGDRAVVQVHISF
jgi:hypothetical protein